MKLVVGLGNPGEKYEHTRHNLGFIVVDKYVASSKYQVLWEYHKKLKSEIVKHEDIVFAKAQTFMNNSGMAVKLIADFYKISVEDIIVIHDDLDLPLGKIKIRQGGSAAGHHGVESIIDVLKDDQFIRLRLGIGNLKTQSAEHKIGHIDTNRFVTEQFMYGEKPKVRHMMKQAVAALTLLLEKGLIDAQNQYN